MEVRQVANKTGDRQIILIGLNKFDVNQLRNPGSRAILICSSENTIMAVARIDSHLGTKEVLQMVVDKLHAEGERRKDEGYDRN